MDCWRLVFERQRAFTNAEEVFPFLPGTNDEHTQVMRQPCPESQESSDPGDSLAPSLSFPICAIGPAIAQLYYV